jgi:hypothetical protein
MCLVVVKGFLLEAGGRIRASEAYPLTNIPIPTSYPQLWKQLGEIPATKARTLPSAGLIDAELQGRNLLTVCIRLLIHTLSPHGGHGKATAKRDFSTVRRSRGILST